MRNTFYQNASHLPPLLTHKTHKIRRFSLFAAIESSMNGGSLSITGLGRCRPQMTLVAAGHKSKKKTPGFRIKSITGMT
jgi:hypothetical protein